MAVVSGLDPVFCPQFCEQPGQVILHGRHADVQVASRFPGWKIL